MWSPSLGSDSPHLELLHYGHIYTVQVFQTQNFCCGLAFLLHDNNMSAALDRKHLRIGNLLITQPSYQLCKLAEWTA